MKFTCVKEKIERALMIAERFTSKSITLPILSNVLLSLDGNTLVVTATNLESAVQINITGKGSGQEKVAVPAKILNSVFQSLKDEKVDLEEKQNNLFIKTQSREARINSVITDDFPLIPKIKKTASVTLDAVVLKQGLEKVIPSVSTSEFKPELTGVLFHISSKNLRLAATDSFRLVEKNITINHNGESFFFILPHKVAQEITRIIGNTEDEVTISVGESQALFVIGEVTLTTRLIEGVFPEYAGIIPKKFETATFIDKNTLLESVRAASIFTSKIQDVSFQFSNHLLTITSINPNVGEQKSSLPVEADGNNSKVSFNYRYLLDGIQILEGQEVFLGINSESASLLHSKTDGSLLYVLMPIRLT